MATERKKRRRAKGSGSIYLRGGKYWLRYMNVDGKLVQESSGTGDKQTALSMLKTKVARIEIGEYVAPKAHTVTVAEIVEYSLSVAVSKGRKNVNNDRDIWNKQLKPAMGRYPALALLDGTKLLEYKIARLNRGLDSDTVNRHFSILRVAYNRSIKRLGGQHPDWRQLFSRETENPERMVFIADDVYPKLCSEASKVGLWMRTLLELACNFGWRLSAWLNLRVAHVELLNCRITLPGALSKNGEPYTAYFTEGDTIYQLLNASISGKAPGDYVLTRNTKHGFKPVRDFRGAWLRITKAAGIQLKPATKGKIKGELTRPGIVFHNTRNTAAIRMIKAGAAEVEAMDIGGWKTRSIFEHYHITDEQAKKRVARNMARTATSELTTLLTTGENNRRFFRAAPKSN
jgi:hypothetical protein